MSSSHIYPRLSPYQRPHSHTFLGTNPTSFIQQRLNRKYKPTPHNNTIESKSCLCYFPYGLPFYVSTLQSKRDLTLSGFIGPINRQAVSGTRLESTTIQLVHLHGLDRVDMLCIV